MSKQTSNLSLFKVSLVFLECVAFKYLEMYFIFDFKLVPELILIFSVERLDFVIMLEHKLHMIREVWSFINIR